MSKGKKMMVLVLALMLIDLVTAFTMTRTTTRKELYTAAGKPELVVTDAYRETYVEAFSGQKNCALTGAAPVKQWKLTFCHKFQRIACCTAAMDFENYEYFLGLNNLGDSCQFLANFRRDPMHKMYCLSCDPEQPRYVRYASYSGLSFHGQKYPAQDYPPEPPRKLHDGRIMGTILVDFDSYVVAQINKESFLGGYRNRNARCGVKKSGPCLDVEGKIIPGRDRFVCGDDYINPPNQFRFHDHITGDLSVQYSAEGYLNDDQMATPILAESMAYRITVGPCTNKEAVEYHQDSYAANNGTYADASNEWSWFTGGGPPCTRSLYQMTKLESDPEGQNIIQDPPRVVDNDGSDGLVTIQDRICRDNFKSTNEGSTAHDNDFCRNTACTTAAEIITDDFTVCCCVKWEDELAFSSGTTSRPSVLQLVWTILVCLLVVLV